MATILSFFFIFFSLCLQGSSTTTFTFQNKCASTVWPGTIAGAGTSQLSTTGFELQSGSSMSLTAPMGWHGGFWGRTFCANDTVTGKFTCTTGDCASGDISCNGAGGIPPASLIEIKLNGFQGMDFFDISLVDGFNLPVSIAPTGVSSCVSSSCAFDINGICPEILQVKDGNGKVVACMSACLKFNNDKMCCRGKYGSPQTCKPSSYAKMFKKACPQAYSYAYDDTTSTFTCTGANYVITF
ncbi:Thaumatin family protein, partial [Dioscorea alata]